jgi:hypothetical protein
MKFKEKQMIRKWEILRASGRLESWSRRQMVSNDERIRSKARRAKKKDAARKLEAIPAHELKAGDEDTRGSRANMLTHR